MAESEDCEEEFRLAQEMKKYFCNQSGKEINVAKSADIIYKIGLIYKKRAPDKLSLIKSVGLLNAAIFRNPSNTSQIKFDLVQICQLVLQQAKSNNQNADLVEKAEEVKASIIKLRKEVEAFMKSSVPNIPMNISRKNLQTLNSEKILAIQQINKTIADNYKKIMAQISQFCQDVMGTPPCEYAIVGMGSLARCEITPYSDFEHIILLCDDENYKIYLEYFKWFSVIFHVIVLNMQETIIPSLNICSLNDKDSRFNDWYYDAITPRGVSFDGMMPHACKFPLGRQKYTKNKPFATELIKPVNEMLKYLSSEADLKNGYHLADILTKTCFVFGNENIFNRFSLGVQNYRNEKSLTDIIFDVQRQVKEDLNSFSTRFRLTALKSQDTINIKQLVYRSTTIFISALARIYNISENSCFDIINEMETQNKITHNTAEKLRCAIAIACEMRLKVYIKEDSQCDNPIDLKQEGDNIQKFLNIVGKVSTINYFQIAYCLQCEMAKQLNFTKFCFYSNAQLINITIGLAFGMEDIILFSNNPKDRFWDPHQFDFDLCIEQLETEIVLNPSNTGIINNLLKVFNKNRTFSFRLNTHQLESIANILFFAEIYDEAVDFYKQLLEIYEKKSTSYYDDYDIAWANCKIASCLIDLNQPADALFYLNQALEIKESATLDSSKDISVAVTLDEIGHCLIDLHQPDKSLTFLHRSLDIKRRITLNAEADKSIAVTLHTIGRCHIDLHNCDKALKYLNEALEIDCNTALNFKTNRDIGVTLHSLGRCHVVMHNHDNALFYLKQALEIKQGTTLKADTDRVVAMTQHEIGICYIDVYEFERALSHLYQALEINQHVTLNADKDKDIAVTLNKIGCCYVNMQQYKKALNYLQRARDIYSNIELDIDINRKFAVAQRNIARCLIGLQQYDDSWHYLEQSLEIFSKTTHAQGTDHSIAKTFHCMGEFFIAKCHHEEALKYLKQALDIYVTTTTNQIKDTELAGVLHDIIHCYMELQNYANALDFLKRLLVIYEMLHPNEHIVKKIEDACSKIDKCQDVLGFHEKIS